MKMHTAASDKGPLRAEYHLLWPSGGRIGALEQKLCERWRRERIRFRLSASPGGRCNAPPPPTARTSASCFLEEWRRSRPDAAPRWPYPQGLLLKHNNHCIGRGLRKIGKNLRKPRS